MFREMRRKDRQLSVDETQKILSEADHGVLALIGNGGYPYAVPLNYAYADGKLYFHSSSHSSHKIDAIRQHNKVCFTVITKHELVLDELSTRYESVVLFGTARILDEPADKAQAIAKMMNVLGRGTAYAGAEGCDMTEYVMVEITPEYVTGKARR